MRSRLSSRPLRHAVIFLVASLSIGCGTVRNPSLERARDAYQKARQDPLIVRNAGAALDRAQLTLETAEQTTATCSQPVSNIDIGSLVEKELVQHKLRIDVAETPHILLPRLPST